MTPKQVTQLQPKPQGVRVRLFQNLKIGNVWHMAGEELTLFRTMAEAEMLMRSGILAIVDPAWENAVVVEDITNTEK